MLLKPTKKILFLTILAFALFAGCTSFATGSISGAVYFGTPQDNGGVCVGRGLCGDNPAGISVTFSVSPDFPDMLIMTFSLSELTRKQPDQLAYFTDPLATYMFDATYNLSADPKFAPLGLPPNSQILTTSGSKIVIQDDVVIDYISYSHDPTN